jgi:MFS family permease
MAIAVIEGLVVAAMLGFVESFIVPILQTVLHATPSQIGILTIVPMVGTTLVGMFLSRVIHWLGGNKRAVLIHTLVQVVCLIGLSAPLYFPTSAWAVPFGLCMAVTIGLASAVGGPAWTSWMGSLVPRRLQSRYLAFRSRWVILMKLGFAALFAGILHVLPAESGPWGFQLLIIIAVLSRLFSAWLIYQQYEPPPRPVLHSTTETAQTTNDRGFFYFLRTSLRNDLGRWTVVWAMLHFGVMLAGPYFAVYMLSPEPRGMGLSPGWQYVMLVQTAVLVRMISYPAVGRLIDLYGPSAMLRVAVTGIMVIPLSWALTNHLPFLLLTEVISGFFWCTAEVAVGVLLFSCHRDSLQRSRLIGYHQSIVTAMAALGALVGSLLLARNSSDPNSSWLPPINESGFHSLFLLSVLMRLPAVILAWRFLPKLRDLKPEESAGLWRLVPGTGMVQTLSRGLMGFFRKPEG